MATETCFIIGETYYASQIAALLVATYGIDAHSYVSSFNRDALINECASTQGLKVVAVCCRNFSDYGVEFIEALRSRINPAIGIHALLEISKPKTTEVERALKKAGANIVFYLFPMTPEKASLSIRKDWFSGVLRMTTKKKQREPKEGSAGSRRRGGRAKTHEVSEPFLLAGAWNPVRIPDEE